MFTGSSPLNGSSRMRRSGSCKTHVMNWIFCCMPLESSSHFLSATSPSSTEASHRSTRGFTTESGTPLSRPMCLRKEATLIFL